MPPRFRPTASTVPRPQVYHDPTAHLPQFIKYQEVEAGVAKNTIAAYESDLTQFFEWLNKRAKVAIADVELKTLTAYLNGDWRRRRSRGTW
jgi:integrase/recombinase XerD